jgi:acetolactate synthase I/II/III large subunit
MTNKTEHTKSPLRRDSHTEFAGVATGGEAMILAAKSNGIDRIFGIPGAQTYPLFDAINHHSMELIVPRHEQAAAYMAMGAAKSTGQPAAFSVVPGPGVLNASAALCTAMGNCSPVLCLTGNIPSSYLGIGRGQLHELKDQLGTLRSIIKDAFRIDELGSTSEIVNQAFHSMTSGRPGPVSIEMCWDKMASSEALTISCNDSHVEAPSIDEDSIAAAASAIRKSKKPMIMCGAGAQHASQEVLALAELLDSPVMAFRSGRGVVSEHHDLGVSLVAGRILWDECDLLIGLGSRVEMPYLRWQPSDDYTDRPEDDRCLIRIDVDPQEMVRFQPDIGVVADSAKACELLVNKLHAVMEKRPGRREEIQSAKARAQQLIQSVQPHIAYLEVIRDVLPTDGFFVPELCQAGFTSFFGFPVLEPRTYVSEGFQGTLGFGYSTGLGVKVANSDKAVISVSGDGGLMFSIQELATAAAYDIGLIAIVFNNDSFGNVRRDQLDRFGGRISGADLVNPDFVKLARSFGLSSVRVRRPSELRKVLAKAVDTNKPTLIEVQVERGSEASPWPFIQMNDAPTWPNSTSDQGDETCPFPTS